MTCNNWCLIQLECNCGSSWCFKNNCFIYRVSEFFLCVSFTRREDATAFHFVSTSLADAILTPDQHLPTDPSIQPPSSGGGAVTLVSQVGEVLEATLAGLTPYTRYAMVMQAYNSRGTGPSSPAITATTLEDSE